MSNKERNWEAVNINRPLITGQAQSTLEAWANAITRLLFGVDLSGEPREGSMWQSRKK
jgi:hypothetical protein